MIFFVILPNTNKAPFSGPDKVFGVTQTPDISRNKKSHAMGEIDPNRMRKSLTN